MVAAESLSCFKKSGSSCAERDKAKNKKRQSTTHLKALFGEGDFGTNDKEETAIGGIVVTVDESADKIQKSEKNSNRGRECRFLQS